MERTPKRVVEWKTPQAGWLGGKYPRVSGSTPGWMSGKYPSVGGLKIHREGEWKVPQSGWVKVPQCGWEAPQGGWVDGYKVTQVD